MTTLRLQFLGEEPDGWFTYIWTSGIQHTIPQSMIRSLTDHGDGTHTIQIPGWQEKYLEAN